MTTIHPQYITNEEGKKLSVVLPISEFEQILDELDDLDDIMLYDEAKRTSEPPMPFDVLCKTKAINVMPLYKIAFLKPTQKNTEWLGKKFILKQA